MWVHGRFDLPEFHKRIEALMIVMTLYLLVYKVAQYRLRQRLKDKHETLLNQLNKPVQNPTLC
jgi:transposase